MKTFAYTAVDPQGQPVSGSVEAADWTRAAELLRAQGFKDCVAAQNGTTAQPVTRLSRAQTVELVGYVAQLAKTGLPLESGLRAMAGDLKRGAVAESLTSLAQQLEAGRSIESVLDDFNPRMPGELRQLVLVASQGGNLPGALDALIEQQQLRDDMARQFWQTVFYPIVVLLMILAWVLFLTLWLAPAMDVESLVADFQTTPVIASHMEEYARLVPRLLLGGLAGTIVVLLATRWFGGRGAVSRLIAQIPLVGPLWWYRGLTEFSGLLTVFLSQKMLLPDALRQVASAANDPAVRAACPGIANDLAAGEPLALSLARRGLFPPTLVQIVHWGEGHQMLAESLRSANELYYERFQFQRELVRTFAPPILFFLAASSILFGISMYFTLFKSIQSLMF